MEVSRLTDGLVAIASVSNNRDLWKPFEQGADALSVDNSSVDDEDSIRFAVDHDCYPFSRCRGVIGPGGCRLAVLDCQLGRSNLNTMTRLGIGLFRHNRSRGTTLDRWLRENRHR